MFPLSSGLASVDRSAKAEGAESCGRSFDLHERLLEELVRHAQDCLPEECCGVLIGAGSSVYRTVAVENASPQNRRREYLAAPQAILESWLAARADGLEIVGYYHSHPSGSATPSALDRREAWPGTSYVILGMKGRDLREVKCWRSGPGDSGWVEDRFVDEKLNCDRSRK